MRKMLINSWVGTLEMFVGDGWIGDIKIDMNRPVSALAVKYFNQTLLSLLAMYTFHAYLLLKALHKQMVGIYT